MTVAGTGAVGSWPGNDGENGPASAAALSFPTGVAVDAWGRLYVSESRYGRVRVITSGAADAAYDSRHLATVIQVRSQPRLRVVAREYDFGAPFLTMEKTLMGSFWSRHRANAVASMMPKLRPMASSKLMVL